MNFKIVNKCLYIISMAFSVLLLANMPATAQDWPVGIPKPPRTTAPLKPTADPVNGVVVRKAEDMGLSDSALKRTKEVANQIKTYGYKRVEEKDILGISYQPKAHEFTPIPDILNNITLPLSTVSGKTGIFKTMTLLGAIPSRPEKKSTQWTRITRYYSLANGGMLTISELDYKRARTSAVFPEELISENINGFPAILKISKAPSGSAFTSLAWASNKKFYELRMSGHVRGVGVKNELVALAMSIQE